MVSDMRTSSLNSTEAVHKRSISAPCFLITSSGSMELPSDLCMALPFAIEHPAVQRAGAVGRSAFEPRPNQQRTVEPAAVLIAAFEVHIRRPGKAEALIEHGQVTRTGIEPHVENVGLFAEFGATAFGASGPGGQQFGGGALIPDVGAVFAEERHDAVENLAVGNRLAAAFAVEHDDGHAPDALARDAPIGAAGDHIGDALFAPCGNPTHFADGLQGLLAKIVALHADEPLLGGAENGGVVAAPAMRVGVRKLLQAAKGVMRLQDLDHDRVSFPDRLADNLFGQAARSAFGMVETAGGIHRAECGDAVLTADCIILLAVTGRGVDGAGALLQSDVIGKDAERIAIEERVVEDGMFDYGAGESGDGLGGRPSRISQQ